jgi:predicted  nucleic acid-binding Zn-ribbon protein
MNEQRQDIAVTTEGTPRWLGLAIAALAAVSLVALGIGWSAVNHARAVEQSATADAKTLQHNVDILTQRLGQAEDSNAQVQGQLNVVTDKLKLTQGELSSARKQTRQIKDENAKQLSEMQSTLKSELDTKASSDDVNKLNGDVTGVKTDLESTKNNIQMARGELGTLIAKNHEEIDELRRLGQRDYYEFSISRKGTRQKVGDLQVELRGANPKKNQFSVALFVDDTRFEKKNRATNEPIYFYTQGSRAPLELVVNKVSKDKIVGYLSVPKSHAAAPASGL